ncbi:MAG: DUF1385 domain-containing protein [Anaerolineales bacterium]
MTERLPSYGGQAVIEGVMMRGVKTVAVAVRDPKGDIQVHQQPLGKAYQNWISRAPFVRGMLGLWDALGLGIRSLLYSADVAAGDEVEFGGPIAWGSIIASLALGLGLFFLAPAAVGQAGEKLLGMSTMAGNLLEGVVRLALVIAYIWAIGLMPDVRRLYGYHGAEHKTINAFEAGAELTPPSVARFPLEHPRCGTAFLLTVVVFSVLLFAALGPLPLLWRLLSRLVLIPVLAALAYEYLRFTARHVANPLVKVLIIPNLALQRLTTREPDLDMLEVAICAFDAMRASELNATAEQTAATAGIAAAEGAASR